MSMEIESFDLFIQKHKRDINCLLDQVLIR
jgi:hypothetical protein